MQEQGSKSFYDTNTRSDPSERRVESFKPKPWYIIDPRSAEILGFWDLLTSIALVFTAIVSPVEVAFLEAPGADVRWTDPLFLCNRVVDIVFIIDMTLQFFMGYSADGVTTP